MRLAPWPRVDGGSCVDNAMPLERHRPECLIDGGREDVVAIDPKTASVVGSYKRLQLDVLLRIVGIRRMNHQLERPSVAKSNGRKMTDVARCQATDSE